MGKASKYTLPQIISWIEKKKKAYIYTPLVPELFCVITDQKILDEDVSGFSCVAVQCSLILGWKYQDIALKWLKSNKTGPELALEALPS